MSDIKFRPVRGLEENILSSSPIDGHIYFATDTGKIFLGKDYEFIPMGGAGVAVLYASGSVIENNNGTYTLSKSSLLDQTARPKETDLIINADGRFFKVTDYNEITEEIICDLIAVSGSGDGTGGGGGGLDPENNISLTIHNQSMSFLSSDKYYLDITATSKVDTTLSLEYTVTNNEMKTTTLSTTIISGQRTQIDVGSYMTEGINSVKYSITGFRSNPYNGKLPNIRMVSMSIETDLENFSNYAIFNGNFPYHVRYYTSSPASLKVFVDGKSAGLKNVSATGSNGATTQVTISPSSLNLSSGTHIITAYLEEAGGFKSNTAEIDFIYHTANAEDAVYIVLTSYPSKILSYEIPEVKYWVYDTSKRAGENNNITFLVNGVITDTTSKPQKEGEALTWLVTGLEPNLTNTCSIRVGQDVERSFEIFVEESGIFDPIEGNAVVLLSSDGRTNDTSLERRSKWEFENYTGKTVSTIFNNFNWENNGWITDANGRSCLRISNGANIEIPIRLFSEYNIVGSSGYTIEFEFKPYNLYSYQSLSQITSIEYDEEGEVTKVNRDYNMNLASITYAIDDGESSAGFGIGTQDTFFRMTSNDNVAARYIEGENINVAIVLNSNNRQMLIYLNGVLSGMATYSDSSAIPVGANAIKINSDYADIDLYTIRMYNRALTSTEIVQNYIASKKSLELYQQNLLGAVDNTVSFEDLEKYNKENPENCTIPYIVFKTKSNPNVLPFNKDNDDIMVDITFVNTAADYKLSLSDKTDNDIEEYLKNAPSFIAEDVRLNVQGTSSQKYPRKNFKGKMLKKDSSTLKCSNEIIPEEKRSMSRLHLAPDAGEKTFTWKADYMDSSGKHNTGFTSFVKEVYNKHPLDYYFGTAGEYYEKYRTTIFGFPVLAFHETSDGKKQFIGRYNFNLDKSCEDSLGMTLENRHPHVADKTYEQVTECWEFGNNKGGLCSFRYKEDFFEDIWNLIEDLEPRYHIDADAIENAFDKKDKSGDNSISEEEAIALIKDKYKHLADLMKWVKESYCGFDLKNSADQTLAKIGMGLAANEEEAKAIPDIEETDEAFIAFKEARKTKFLNEFKLHFNEEYCLIYYVMTEVLVLFDSRGKNMMLASWGPQEDDGDYIWFPIFYDVDTQLGINNSGYPTMEYNVEPSNEGLFSTNNSLFWRSFGEVFASAIRSKYREIRNGNFTEANINAYYDFDEEKSIAMKGILPISIINADAFYKYILPSYDVSNGGGYVVNIDSSNRPEYKTSSAYFYCVQGTRDLYRAQFLRNRFNYDDSMMLAKDYAGKLSGVDTLRWRVATKNYEDDSLDSNFIVNLTPVLDQYIIGYPDESDPEALLPYTVKAEAGKSVAFDLTPFLPSDSAKDQIVNIPGGKFIQKFGDLSRLYISEIELPENVNEIILGNSNPNYNNDMITNNFNFDQLNDNRPLLKEYDVTNLAIMKSGVNLEDSPKLETFKALGTNISGVTFADNPNLSQVYLPKTIQNLKFNKAFNLTKILENLSNENEKGLYIKDLIHEDANENSVVQINNIDIIGQGFHQYSYNFLEKLINKKLEMNNKNLASGYTPYLGIQMKDVLWSPYKQLGEGAIYDSSKRDKYFYAKNDFTFEDYSYLGEEYWNLDVANGRIYEYIGSEAPVATNLSLLDKLIENSIFVKSYAFGLTNEEMGTPYLSGELYIDNSEPISETEITNKYNVYFPDLKIKVKSVNHSYRVRFVQRHEPTMGNVEKELLVLRFDPNDYSKEDLENSLRILPTAPDIIHYDNNGEWEYEDGGETAIVKSGQEIIPLIGDFSSIEHTFYTHYEKHKYKITFNYDDSEAPAIKEVLYDEIIGTPLDLYPYKDESALNLTECYKFSHYTTSKDGGIKIDLDNLKATKDLILYAQFTKDSVYNNVLDPKYGLNVRVQDNSIQWDESKKSMVEVYKKTFKGKITLPTVGKSGNLAESVYIGTMQLFTKITHIFFEPTGLDSIKEFNSYCFSGCGALKFLEIPKDLSEVRTNALSGINSLSAGSIGIYDSAKRIVYLPGSIKTVEEMALGLGSKGRVSLQIGSDTDLWDIESLDGLSSNMCGTTVFDKVTIYSTGQDFINEETISNLFPCNSLEIL